MGAVVENLLSGGWVGMMMIMGGWIAFRSRDRGRDRGRVRGRGLLGSRVDPVYDWVTGRQLFLRKVVGFQVLFALRNRRTFLRPFMRGRFVG